MGMAQVVYIVPTFWTHIQSLHIVHIMIRNVNDFSLSWNLSGHLWVSVIAFFPRLCTNITVIRIICHQNLMVFHSRSGIQVLGFISLSLSKAMISNTKIWDLKCKRFTWHIKKIPRKSINFHRMTIIYNVTSYRTQGLYLKSMCKIIHRIVYSLAPISIWSSLQQ